MMPHVQQGDYFFLGYLHKERVWFSLLLRPNNTKVSLILLSLLVGILFWSVH